MSVLNPTWPIVLAGLLDHPVDHPDDPSVSV
jgi:hypothetical protein